MKKLTSKRNSDKRRIYDAGWAAGYRCAMAEIEMRIMTIRKKAIERLSKGLAP